MPTTVYGLSEAEVDSNTEISVHEIAPRSWRGFLGASLGDKFGK
jgi:hypothetical protein